MGEDIGACGDPTNRMKPARIQAKLRKGQGRTRVKLGGLASGASFTTISNQSVVFIELWTGVYRVALRRGAIPPEMTLREFITDAHRWAAHLQNGDDSLVMIGCGRTTPVTGLQSCAGTDAGNTLAYHSGRGAVD
jgi:hypothetical protein